MTGEERKILLRRVSGYKLNPENFKELAGITISAGIPLVFLVVLLWLLLAWIVRTIFGFDFGWNYPHGTIIFWSIICLSLSYIVVSVIRSQKPNHQRREKLILDIKNGKILVEEHRLTEAKVFEEPEHGGYIYFFRTTEGKVFVFFDNESQDLAVGGEDAKMSSFVPRTQLKVERTPIAKDWIRDEIFGTKLAVTEPLLMTDDTNKWPPDGEFIDISWSDIVTKYGA